MNLNFLKRPEGIRGTCMVLSLFTTLAFHIPAFKAVLENIEKGWNGALIFTSVVILMLVANYFFYYLLLWLGRGAGKAIIAFTFIADAVSLYFINTYEVLITAAMMGNVFNTRFSEAEGFFSMSAVLYILFLGIPPCIYLYAKKTSYGTLKKFLKNIGTSLLIIAIVVLANMRNTLWIDNNSTELGSLLMPRSYTVNSVRYYGKMKQRNRKRRSDCPTLISPQTPRMSWYLS